MSRLDRRPIVAPLGSFFPRSLFGGGKGGGGAALTCSPSILARSASTCAMTSKKRSREKEGESGGGRGRKESSRRANRFLELKPPSRPSMFFLREETRSKTRKPAQSLFSNSLSVLRPSVLLVPKTMISLRSSAGVRVAPAVSSSLSSSRAAIAPRSAAPAPLSMMPARVSSSSRRSLKSLAPRAAAGSPPAFGAYGES